MNGKDLLLNLGYIGDDLIEEAETLRFDASSRRGLRRPALVAALIAAALLLVGCAVAYALSVGSLRIGERQVTEQRFSADGSEYLGEETVTQQVLTRAGIVGSPEYKAAQEWYEFRQSYDPDGAIFQEVQENRPAFPKEYDGYNLYTQEMKDKLDEILSKYQLKPVGAGIPFQTPKLLFEALGIENVLRNGSGATMDTFAGALYESGTLGVDGNVFMNPKEVVHMTAFYTPKGYFNENVVYLSDIQNWNQENYVTASGNQVLLLFKEGEWGWVFYNGKQNLVCIHAEADNMEQLKALAEAVDLDLKIALPESYKTEELGTDGWIGDFHFELKDVLSDGHSAWITIAVTAPEDVKLLGEGGLASTEHLLSQRYLTHRNIFGFWEPTDSTLGNKSYSFGWEDDGDGKDNTANFVLRSTNCEEGKPFGIGKTWRLYWEDLCLETWDEEIGDYRYETVAQGTWNLKVTFESNLEGELKLIREPITAEVAYGWDVNGNTVTKMTQITSFRLYPLSGAITCTEEEVAPDFLFGGSPVVLMKDGSEITLERLGAAFGTQELEAEQPIDIDQVECVLLADGTKLAANP